jgi:hypothetical protein
MTPCWIEAKSLNTESTMVNCPALEALRGRVFCQFDRNMIPLEAPACGTSDADATVNVLIVTKSSSCNYFVRRL